MTKKQLVKKDWFIETETVGRGRWGWRIAYPISRFAIGPTKSFASKSAAMRDAYRVIRILIKKGA